METSFAGMAMHVLPIQRSSQIVGKFILTSQPTCFRNHKPDLQIKHVSTFPVTFETENQL